MSVAFRSKKVPTLDANLEADGTESLYEIEDGRVLELPNTSLLAGYVGRRIFLALHSYVAANNLGVVVFEIVFLLDAARKLGRRPDVAFVSTARWPRDFEMPDEGHAVIVPDLAIEVISPRDRMVKVMRKLGEYFRYGVREVWLVEPTEQMIYVYRALNRVQVLGPDDELDGGDVLPGFRLPIGPLFRKTLD